MAPSGERGTWKALGEVSSIGVPLGVTTVLGLVAGYYADRWLGTKPWLLLLGLGFGIAAGFVNLFRSVKRAERELDDFFFFQAEDGIRYLIVTGVQTCALPI